MLSRLNLQDVSNVIVEDPVRPHLPAEWRIMCGREVYALYEDQYSQPDRDWETSCKFNLDSI